MDKIAVLDFGGQYAHLIANRIRRLGVYSEILDASVSSKELVSYKGIILSGGPASVLSADSPKCDPSIFHLGIPILGICYGHQLTAHILGGSVKNGHVREYGHATVKILERAHIFENLENDEIVWMSHFDQVDKVPSGFKVIALTEDCPIAAMADYDKRIYTLQFHPEVTHTPCGLKILKNFVNLTNAKHEWNIEDYSQILIDEIRNKVGSKKVFMLVSGGVDSSVAFLLLEKALGQDNVYGLFVDTGFMRLNERVAVEEALKRVGVGNLHVYDAGKDFFEALKGVYDPEEKRKIIGNLFLDVQRRVSDELGLNLDEWMLGQGTIYPDTIETGGTKHAEKIKTHHNRVEAIQKLIDEGRVIEPISQFYKDEVRVIGEKFGMPLEMVWRHPFPGPGLAVRCLCAEKESYPENIGELSSRIADFLDEYECRGKILPVKSVGVQGDERTYKNPVVIYGKDFDWDEIHDIATRLINNFSEINRVVWGLNDVDFSSVAVRDSFLTTGRVSVLQRADDTVMNFIYRKGLQKEIWQFPTVMLPLFFGNSNNETIVLRPVSSEEAMTANFYRMESNLLDQLVKELSVLPNIGGILYDVTNKPPGTIEWE